MCYSSSLLLVFLLPISVFSFSVLHKYQWASQVALVVKNPPANEADARDTRDAGSIPGLGRSTGESNGNHLRYSCLENSMDIGTWWTTVHGVTKKSDTIEHICMSDFSRARI